MTRSARWMPPALLLVAVATQVAFHLLDGRLPRDPGRYFGDTLRWYWRPDWIEALATPGGWVSHLLASGEHLLGRGPLVFVLHDTGWLAVLLLALLAMGRALGGPRVAASALALTLACPTVLVLARHPWIHLSEAAALLWIPAILALDPRLRWFSAVAVGSAGTLALLTRPSSLGWIGLAIPCLLLSRRAGWLAWRQLPWVSWLIIALFWVPAAWWTQRGMGAYLDVKNAESWGGSPLWILEQLPVSLGWIGLVAIAAGLLGLGLAARSGARVPRERVALAALLGLWSVAPLGLMLRFHSGSQDFTHWSPLLATLAALGLPHLHPALPRFAPALAVLPILPLVLGSAGSRLWGARDLILPFDLSRPDHHALTAGDWSALFDHACPSRSWLSCNVVAPLGLFAPLNEDPGWLELHIMEEDRIELRGLGDHPQNGWQRWPTHLAVWWSCDDLALEHLEKHPDLYLRSAELFESLDLTTVWSRDIGPRCTLHALAPATLVPLERTGTRELDTEQLRAMNEAYYAAEPDRRGITHLPRSMERGQPPQGWRRPVRPPRR